MDSPTPRQRVLQRLGNGTDRHPQGPLAAKDKQHPSAGAPVAPHKGDTHSLDFAAEGQQEPICSAGGDAGKGSRSFLEGPLDPLAALSSAALGQLDLGQKQSLDWLGAAARDLCRRGAPICGGLAQTPHILVAGGGEVKQVQKPHT